MVRMSNSCLMLAVASFLAITGARGGIIIEPNPNEDVGMMSSESKYFNCKSDKPLGMF